MQKSDDTNDYFSSFKQYYLNETKIINNKPKKDDTNENKKIIYKEKINILNVFKKIYLLLIQIVFWYILFDFIIFKYVIQIERPFWLDGEHSKYLHPYSFYISSDIAKSDFKSIYYNPQESLFKNINKDDIKVAFFGGSTGLIGDPRIADELEKELSVLLNRNVKVVNFSAHGAVHTQFLHMMIEYLDEQFFPDIVIFYCGNNEIEINLGQDLRPGYPEWFYYSESPEWLKFLINYSALFATLFENNGIKFFVENEEKLQERFQFDDDKYIKYLTYNYFSVIEKANFYTRYLKSDNLKKPVFLAFFQPFHYKDFAKNQYNLYVKSIKNNIKNYEYIIDVHEAYDDLGPEVWDDNCHVHGEANIKMSKIIAYNIYKKIKDNNLLK